MLNFSRKAESHDSSKESMEKTCLKVKEYKGHIIELIEKAYPNINEGIQLIVADKTEEKADLIDTILQREPKFQRIVQACFSIMTDSIVIDLLNAQEEAHQDIEKCKKEIAEKSNKIIIAPADSWNPFQDTKKSLKKDIEAQKNKIATIQSEFTEKKMEVFDTLRMNGIPITLDQFEQVINAADGLDQAKILCVAEILREIQAQLSEEANKPDSCLETIQHYVGVHMMLHRVYLHAIRTAIQKISAVYEPRLQEMLEQNKKELSETKKLRSAGSFDAHEQKILNGNLETLKRNIEVIGLYSSYLGHRVGSLTRISLEAERKFSVAVNTYKTVRLSTELLGLIQNSTAEFEHLLSFNTGELTTLYSDRFREEFTKISAKLKEG